MSTVDYSDFSSVQKAEKFQTLRSTHRKFVFPMTVVFLLWYLGFVVVAAFLPEVMAIQVLGNINLGIVLGLAQFVTTFIITGAYVAYANRKIDPLAADLREEMEAAGAVGTTLDGADGNDFATSGKGSGE
jgi:uncharacterized membrane protein (DUF485 family)